MADGSPVWQTYAGNAMLTIVSIPTIAERVSVTRLPAAPVVGIEEMDRR